MRGLIALLVIGALAFGLSLTEQTWATTAEHRAVEFATLPCDTNVQAVASGYLIDDRTVVTVAHALWNVSDIALRRSGDDTWHRRGDFVIEAIDLERDLALVRVDDLRALPADTTAARLGEGWKGAPVTMVGGASSGTVEGEVRRRVNLTTEVVGDRSRTNTRRGFEVGIEIAPGDSGSAIVDDEDQLVGIVFARSRRTAATTWVTHHSELAELSGVGIPTEPWLCQGFGKDLVLTSPTPARLAG